MKVTSLKIITNRRTNKVNTRIILTQVSTVQLVTFLVSNCRIEIPRHKFTPPDMTSLTMNNKSKLSPYTLLNIVPFLNSVLSFFKEPAERNMVWSTTGFLRSEQNMASTACFPFHKHRKHISLHYNKLQELFRATTSTARSPMSFEESATTLFLTIPGPIFPSYTTSSNYVFEYKKIEPGKQKD